MLDGYQAFILLPLQNAPSIDALAERLRQRVKQELQQAVDRLEAATQIEITAPNHLRISISPGEGSANADWQMQVYTNREPSVLVEAQAIAAAYMEPDDPRQLTLATYDFRIEIGCDPDPNMERFNHYVYVLEALATLPGAIVFDPKTTGFIE